MSDSVVPPEIQDMARDAVISPARNDWMIVAGAGLLIGIVATVWIYYKRRHRRHRLLHVLGPSHVHAMGTGDPNERPAGEHRHKHSRRRRWGRRNPTLAQTGGLPPTRSSDTPTAQPH